MATVQCFYHFQQSKSEFWIHQSIATRCNGTHLCSPRKERNPSSYHLSRRDTQSSTTKVIQLELPKPSSVEPISILQDNEVKCCFLYDVFELVRRVHTHPEQVANGSLKALLLKELEKAENKHLAESAKISTDRQDWPQLRRAPIIIWWFIKIQHKC